MKCIRLLALMAIAVTNAAVGCEPEPGPDCHKEIFIRNISGEIRFVSLLPGTIEGIPCRNIPDRLEPGETFEFAIRPCWEDEINRTVYAGEVALFVVDSLPFETVAECDSVELDQLITNVIRLDLEELQQLDFMVDIE